jgi:hypothetical protein
VFEIDDGDCELIEGNENGAVMVVKEVVVVVRGG